MRENIRKEIKKRKIRKGFMSVFLAGTAALLLSSCKKSGVSEEAPITVQERLSSYESLARFEPMEFSGGASSYDRTGGNADGFGESNFLYEETDGRKVLLDRTGTGVIWRMWFTGFSQTTELWIEIDGREAVKTKLYRLFNGTEENFPMPLSVNDVLSSGGFVSYVPIPYQKSIRILALPEGDTFFYQMNYSEFPAGTKLVSWEEQDSSELNELWRTGVLKDTGEEKEVQTFNGELQPGGQLAIAEVSGEKLGEQLKIRLNGELLSDGTVPEELWNQVYLRMYWDGEETPSVDVPLGAFFGTGSFGSYPVNSLLVKVSGNELLSMLPMPVERKARIELYSKYDKAVQVEGESIWVPSEKAAEYGYLHTQYIRHSCKKGDQTSMKVLSAEGRGNFIGLTQSLHSVLNQGIADRWHLEGDERIYVDGRKTPSVQGTGTEDFYNGGWYFSRGLYSNQLSGYTHFAIEDRMDSTSMYRFLMGDKVVFRDGIEVWLEHGAVNDVTEEVETLAFYYQRPEPAMRKTDEFRLEDEKELERHGFQAEENKKTWSGHSCYEGEYNTRTEYTAVSCRTSRFTMQLQDAEQGAVLRRTFDQKEFHQQAEVLIDGKSAGIWYTAGGNGLKKLCDSDFYIGKEFVEGKTEVEITIQPTERNAWNSISYEIYAVK